jgi:hypothetical protein
MYTTTSKASCSSSNPAEKVLSNVFSSVSFAAEIFRCCYGTELLKIQILKKNPELPFVRSARIWRDFGLALPFLTRLTQTKPVLPLPNEHGS